jgi:hypothetical protein
MNRDAVVEDQVELFHKVAEKLAARMKAPIDVQIKLAVFQQVNNWMMNETINKQQNERYAKKEQKAEEPPSAAQVAYAEDLGIAIPEGCTKRQLSKLIEQAK